MIDREFVVEVSNAGIGADYPELVEAVKGGWLVTRACIEAEYRLRNFKTIRVNFVEKKEDSEKLTKFLVSCKCLTVEAWDRFINQYEKEE